MFGQQQQENEHPAHEQDLVSVAVETQVLFALSSSCDQPALPYWHVSTAHLQPGHDTLPEWVKHGSLHLHILWFAALGLRTEQVLVDVVSVLERSILEMCCLVRDGSVLLTLTGGTWGCCSPSCWLSPP